MSSNSIRLGSFLKSWAWNQTFDDIRWNFSTILSMCSGCSVLPIPFFEQIGCCSTNRDTSCIHKSLWCFWNRNNGSIPVVLLYFPLNNVMDSKIFFEPSLVILNIDGYPYMQFSRFLNEHDDIPFSVIGCATSEDSAKDPLKRTQKKLEAMLSTWSIPHPGFIWGANAYTCVHVEDLILDLENRISLMKRLAEVESIKLCFTVNNKLYETEVERSLTEMPGQSPIARGDRRAATRGQLTPPSARIVRSATLAVRFLFMNFCDSQMWNSIWNLYNWLSNWENCLEKVRIVMWLQFVASQTRFSWNKSLL